MAESLYTAPAFLNHIPQYVRDMNPYRPGKPLEELKEELGVAKIIKLASNENPFGVPESALKAVQEGLGGNHWYPDPVSRRLRRKIASRYAITPEEIAVVAGSESLLATIVRAFIQPGDKAVQGFGAFMGLEIHLSAHGGVLHKVPSPHYRFDADAIIAATTPDVKLLYLPNPNNPTGTYLSHDEVAHILKHVPQSTLVLLDEAYIEFCETCPDFPQALHLRQDNLLILRTFSKAYGLAGLRVGYGIGHPDLIEQLMKVKMTFEPSLPAQLAAEAVWDDHAFLTKVVHNNTTERARYQQVLTDLGLEVIPSVANFVMVACRDEAYVNRLNEALLKRGIAVRPLAAFDFPHCVRITIGLPEENEAVFEALREIVPTLT